MRLVRNKHPSGGRTQVVIRAYVNDDPSSTYNTLWNSGSNRYERVHARRLDTYLSASGWEELV